MTEIDSLVEAAYLENECYEAAIKQLDAVREAISDAIKITATDVNTKSVREGLEMGGYVKHYILPRYSMIKIKNALGEK